MPRTISPALRHEALRLLERRGSLLELGREISGMMHREKIPGVVIGGIAVVLHGHVRSTTDIDIFLEQPLDPLAKVLCAQGFQYDEARREFIRDHVPLLIVTRAQVARPPRNTIEIEGITTVSLADLIEMKLESGSKNVLRAQDLADVIGLIRKNGLKAEFARHLHTSLRMEYRKLVKALREEKRNRGRAEGL